MKKIPIFLFFTFAFVSFACSLTVVVGPAEEFQTPLPESEFPEIKWNELIWHQAVAGGVVITQTGPDTLNLSGEINKDIILLEENAAYFEIIHTSGGGEWRLYFYRQGEQIFWGLENYNDPDKLNI